VRILEIPVGRHRLLRLLVVCGVWLQLFAVGSANASGRLPTVPAYEPAPYEGHGLEVRPATIAYSLTGALVGRATDRASTGRLHWRRWTKEAAVGSGFDEIQKAHCGILCPNGNYAFYRAHVRLHRPRVDHGYLVFTRMTITYAKRIPPGDHRARTLDLTFVGGTFNWGPAFEEADL
jgi:hypothetical protein